MFAHEGVAGEIRGATGGENLPFAHDVGAIDDAEGLADVVVGDQNAHIAIAQFRHNLLYLSHGDRVDPGKGLIQKQKTGAFGARGQRSRQFCPPPLAPRHLNAQGVGHLLEAKLFEQVLQAIAILLGGHPRLLHHQKNIVSHRQITKNAGFLGQIANPQPRPLVHGQIGNVDLVKANSAPVRPF